MSFKRGKNIEIFKDAFVCLLNAIQLHSGLKKAFVTLSVSFNLVINR